MLDSARNFVGALDQGTSSTRFLVFDLQTGEIITYSREEVDNICPTAGYVEQDPSLLYETSVSCINKCVKQLLDSGIASSCIKAIGITNQRETTIAWDRRTGLPLYNAIVWLDNRTSSLVEKYTQKAVGKSINVFQNVCGLPISTYFSALKMRWLLDECQEVQIAARKGTLLMGTVDSWLLWKFTCGKQYATDVTNASRTMLMNIHTAQWDNKLCKFFCLDPSILPEIRSSSEVFGTISDVDCSLFGCRITAMLGDQQAALVGHGCMHSGQVKTTYGTGCFLLCNTGMDPVFSRNGLLTTVAYQFGGRDQPIHYALEGSLASGGSTLDFLRDNLNLFASIDDLDGILTSMTAVDKCNNSQYEGPYFVSAFTGLLCPHWDPNARTCLVGLNFSTTRSELVRAALEGIAFQIWQILDAIDEDMKSNHMKMRSSHMSSSKNRHLTVRDESEDFGGKDDLKQSITSVLRADGGLAKNDNFLQTQANLSGLTVERPTMQENTALGVAIAAALGADLDPSILQMSNMEQFYPQLNHTLAKYRYSCWKRAVLRSLNWKCSEEEMREELNEFELVSARTKLLSFGLRSAYGRTRFFCGVFPLVTLSLGILLGLSLSRWSNR